MAYAPIQLISVPIENYDGWWLKFYAQGTTTPLSMATDSTGGTLIGKAEISSGGTVPAGFLKTSGNALLNPHMNAAYDAWLFPTAAEADANDTTNAIQLADNITADPASSVTIPGYTVTDKAAAVLITPVAGKTMFVESSDGGLFKYKSGVGLTDDDPTYCGTQFIPTGGDGSIAWENTSNLVTPAQFGAVGDGVIYDTDALQNAYDTVGLNGGGELFIPQQSGDYYLTKQALRFRYPNVTVRCENAATRIHCDGLSGAFSRWPNYGSVVMGTYTSNNYVLVTSYPLNAVTRNDETATTTTAGDAANFSVDNVVLVQATTAYAIGADSRPTWATLNVVTSVDAGTGIIGLRHPIQKTDAAEILNLSDNGTNWLLSDGTDTGELNFAVRDCAILGGWWSTDIDEAPFFGGGGLIDCVIKPDRTSCRNGAAYGNLISHSLIEVNLQESRRSGIELAFCSHDNVVNIGTDELKDQEAGFTATDGNIWINEGSRNNTVNVKTMHGNNFANDNAICLNNVDGNIVNVGTVYADSVTNGMIKFLDSAYTGTRPDCNNNTVSVGKILGGSATHSVQFTGNGQEFNNRVESGRFYGAVTNAINFAGNALSEDSVDNCWFQNGGLLIGASSTNHKVNNSYVPDGLALSSDWDTEIQKGQFNNVETDASRLLREVNTIDISQSATDGVPYTFSSTVKANSMSSGDSVSFYMGTSIPGASSASNKTWTISFDGNTVQTYTTASTGVSEVIIRGVITYATNTAAIIHYTIFQDDVAVSTRVETVTGVDFTTDQIFSIVVAVTAASGDSLNMRHAQTVGNSASSGSLRSI